MEAKRFYKWICILNLVIFLMIAIIFVPYFGKEWGDKYFAGIRTIILCIHYMVHTLFLCVHCKLMIRKSFWIIISVSAHIYITYKLIPISLFFWTYI